jgi:hypothetical protein
VSERESKLIACPTCGSETTVVDVRGVTKGREVRRRRQCVSCKQRVTTFEQIFVCHGTKRSHLLYGIGEVDRALSFRAENV